MNHHHSNQRFLWSGEWREIAISECEITELGPGHFLVASQNERFEVFTLPDGTLSDGSALDGISLGIESERERIIRERFQGKTLSGTIQTGLHVIKAPMPGLLRAISVRPGDEVERTTTVLILEAMKMENNILASAKGRVKRVLVEEGTSVEKNASLIEIELL
ncbi:MAG TPA: biotin/lipoyl-containing protein [Candidatus Kapabacteria bacterium]|nr:biotin/lipoyl-containing protein [Candidatus Kapabacteria bacterium]